MRPSIVVITVILIVAGIHGSAGDALLRESVHLMREAGLRGTPSTHTPNGAYRMYFPGFGSGTVTATLDRDPKDEKYPFCPTKGKVDIWVRGTAPSTKLNQEQQLCFLENWEVSYDPKTKHYVQDAPGLNITRSGGPPADWRFGSIRMADDPSYAEVGWGKKKRKSLFLSQSCTLLSFPWSAHQFIQ